MNAESWTAGATVALVVVGVTQALLFLWQLTLLRRSVRDSAEAVRAATEAADAARAANRISREAMASEQRPWVTLKTQLAASLSHGARDGWSIELSYSIKNIGKTPARRVGFLADVIPFMMGYQEPGGSFHAQTNIANELHDFARRMLNAKAGGGGFSLLLFPEDSREGRFVVNKSDAPFAKALESERYTGQFIVLTCVIYQSTLDHNWHETAEAYSLHLAGANSRIELTDGRLDLAGRGHSFVSHPLADPYAT